MQQIEYSCLVIRNERLNSQTVVLTLNAPEIAAKALPGQFLNLACNQFLKRPLGIMDADPAGGIIKVGIRIQGEGTRWLAGRQAGEHLTVLGPLGHGFSLANVSRVITVGGGTGVFPLYFVQKCCRKLGIESIAVCGYRSKEESVLTDDYGSLSCQTVFASDSGDMDFAGHAAQALSSLLDRLPIVPGTAVLTCGPKVMMQAVAELTAERNLPCQVSLEERMACGIGICLVCACRIKVKDSGTIEHQRCCAEGPVFPAEVVEWQT